MMGIPQDASTFEKVMIFTGFARASWPPVTFETATDEEVEAIARAATIRQATRFATSIALFAAGLALTLMTGPSFWTLMVGPILAAQPMVSFYEGLEFTSSWRRADTLRKEERAILEGRIPMDSDIAQYHLRCGFGKLDGSSFGKAIKAAGGDVTENRFKKAPAV